MRHPDRHWHGAGGLMTKAAAVPDEKAVMAALGVEAVKMDVSCETFQRIAGLIESAMWVRHTMRKMLNWGSKCHNARKR